MSRLYSSTSSNTKMNQPQCKALKMQQSTPYIWGLHSGLIYNLTISFLRQVLSEGVCVWFWGGRADSTAELRSQFTLCLRLWKGKRSESSLWRLSKEGWAFRFTVERGFSEPFLEQLNSSSLVYSYSLPFPPIILSWQELHTEYSQSTL